MKKSVPISTQDVREPAGTGTLGKAIAVLDIIAASPEPLRFTDVLHLTNQPRGTLHRQISNLIEEGLLTVNRDHSYALGLRLLQFASKAWASNRFRTIAEPHLQDCTRRPARRCISVFCAEHGCRLPRQD